MSGETEKIDIDSWGKKPERTARSSTVTTIARKTKPLTWDILAGAIRDSNTGQTGEAMMKRILFRRHKRKGRGSQYTTDTATPVFLIAIFRKLYEEGYR